MVVFNSKYGHQINCTNVYDINLDAYIVGLLQNQSINSNERKNKNSKLCLYIVNNPIATQIYIT